MAFRLGILASGRGSNFVAIQEAISAGQVPAEIAVVITDQSQAGVRERTGEIPCLLMERSAYDSKQAFEIALAEKLAEYKVDLVVLAGFMRLLGGAFLSRFPGRVLNIHPSLLPSFPGLHPQQQALDYGVKVSGCTVHFVDEGMDSGPVIMQQAVPVLDEDTEETLAARILEQEHKLYPAAIALCAQGKISLTGRKTLQEK
ncbi:MAG: phosphoribosylglycinamide formyltransferase [Sporomusaceae bacterium]|nr:phosphoribosylglycinamide formyltransferase [Sporomusaceae bacterium]